MMKATGISGTMEIVGDSVVVTKSLFFGKSAGPRIVPIADIEAVAFAEAGLLSNGHIQLVHKHSARKRRLLETLDQDPDTIMFVRRDQGPFEALRDTLRERIARPAAGSSLESDLRALARLHAEGILSDDEYGAGKRRLLGLDHNM